MARRPINDPVSLELLEAAFLCDFVRVRTLLADGADPEVRDEDERTPLFSAILGNSVGVLALLLEAGADPNAQDRDGWSPLHFAAQEHTVELARILVGRGANPNLRDNDGATALWRAVQASRGRSELVSILRQSGARDDLANNQGETPRELDQRLGLGVFNVN
ncbi:MAG TPA: ankyrin repeat domain-containing protein [Polyangia bacterium]